MFDSAAGFANPNGPSQRAGDRDTVDASELLYLLIWKNVKSFIWFHDVSM